MSVKESTGDKILCEDQLRKAWEAGFRLAIQYSDNYIHFDGEQKERHWQNYLNIVAKKNPQCL